MPSETSSNFFGRLKNRKDYPLRPSARPTHEQVAEATERFLTNGGTIQYIPTIEFVREPFVQLRHDWGSKRFAVLKD